MPANPFSFLREIFSKVIAAAAKLPALLLFAILAVITLIAGLIAMAVLHVNLQNNVLWLIGIVLVGALVGSILIEFKHSGNGSASNGHPRQSATPPPSTPTQRIIYDSTKPGSVGFAFKGRESPIYDAKGKPITPEGKGELRFEEGGILNVRRQNVDGRFEIWLMKYFYDRKEQNRLPKSETIPGQRKLLLSLQAKVSGGATHTLRAVLRDIETSHWLADHSVKVMENTWTDFQLYLSADPSRDANLRLDDLNVSRAPSSLQIRRICFTEEVSE